MLILKTKLSTLAVLIVTGVGCNPCEKLADKLCDDLGAEDCAVWKTAGGPGAISGGRRAARSCVNSYFGPTYDATLAGAKATVVAYKGMKKSPQ